jgi:N-acetylglutamate synthase-like GNAT family acetyltransferase
MIEIRQLKDSEIGKIAEIDRTEHVTLGYVYRDGKLEQEKVDWRVPRWPREGSWGVEARIKQVTRILQEGGMMLGAFDGALLVGIAGLRYNLTDTMAQLTTMFVSTDYRRQGIAAMLAAEIIRLAKEAGAQGLYVSATPSESAVGFYRSQGFRLAEKVNKELYALEPEDIHMIKTL